MSRNEANRVYADKGSPAMPIAQFLRKQRSRAQCASRVQKQNHFRHDKLANQLISKKRYRDVSAQSKHSEWDAPATSVR
ncbi:MAG: hypothetical protein IPO71_02055 [Nitrosomonas sp.]|nr:hypothetical protein [Nitrosomonas sp.]